MPALNGPRQRDEVVSTSGRYSGLGGKSYGADLGYLVLAGDMPSPWYLSVPPGVGRDGEGVRTYCISGSGWTAGDKVRLDIGLELADHSGESWGDSAFGGGVCLDGSGAVISFLATG